MLFASNIEGTISHRKLPNCWVAKRSMSQAFVVKFGVFETVRYLSGTVSRTFLKNFWLPLDLRAWKAPGLITAAKPWTLEMFHECSCLCYHESQQRSRHELRASHKTTNRLKFLLAVSFFRPRGFFLRHSNIPEIFLVFSNTTYMYYNNRWLKGGLPAGHSKHFSSLGSVTLEFTNVPTEQGRNFFSP